MFLYPTQSILFHMVHTFTYYLLIVIISTCHLLGICHVFLHVSCLPCSFMHPACLHYLPCHLSCHNHQSSFSCHSNFLFHSLIKFEVWYWFPFSNNDACCIKLTPVLIDFALFFCFINRFINVLLGLMCISVSSALCIVISQYLSLI